MKDLFLNSAYELFNDGWEFIAPQSEESVSVTLPHSWNSVGWTYESDTNMAPSGTGIYLKHISGKKYNGFSLKFEGVSVYCEVFLNETKIGENLGAHKPFEVTLGNLCLDDNLLVVKVTDKASVELLPENCDDIFIKSARYKRWPIGLGSSLKAGGIWRNVYLIKKQPVYMKPFIIHSSGTDFSVETDISGCTDDFKIKYTLSDENGTNELMLDANCKNFRIAPEVPVLSWPLKPHLYEFKAVLYDSNQKICQTIVQPAALMNFTVRNSEFRINNRPYFLRGQNGFPHCNIAYGKEYIEKYVSALKKQGVEISRFHTEPPSHEWLDECDRQGIMVILEMPLHGSFGCYSYGSGIFRENALSETLSVVREYRRHPSIVMWSMGNELIVACERDAGLGKPLFDILENWISEVKKLDCRPVISNSNGDAANLVTKTVGDVDDVHQYGGWYTENLYDLRHFGEYTVKNDMLFQPCISTESIAGYTDENERFFIKHGDIRQKKVVDMRLGKITDLAGQSRSYQQFMLKEYAEAMWRLRTPKSSFAGYIPFGQYTWFFRPFEKDGIIPKAIWSTYRMVMSPVHVQLESFSRHIYRGCSLDAALRIFNEDIHIEDNPVFDAVISAEGREICRYTFSVQYHESVCRKVSIGPLHAPHGEISVDVSLNGTITAHNILEYRTYEATSFQKNGNMLIYDPENMIDIEGKRIENLCNINRFEAKKLLVGPYALDDNSSVAADNVLKWIKGGGTAIVLEQTPGCHSDNIFNTGISSARVCQPQWSRWAMNLVKHADRMDICCPDDKMFEGINDEDMFWWNGDTYLADSYLYALDGNGNDDVLSQIGNGLSEGELMPQKYEYRDSGYSITTIKRKIGNGCILCTSLLIGSKCKTEPTAQKILNNLVRD